MKVNNDTPDVYTPKSIRITFDTQDELQKFYDVFNTNSVVDYFGGLESAFIRIEAANQGAVKSLTYIDI